MPEIKKNYNKQEFAKEDFSKGASAVVVTEEYKKRSNIDDIGEFGVKQPDHEFENVFVGEELELLEGADFGSHAKEQINNSLDTVLTLGENSGGDVTVELEFADGEKSSEVAFLKTDFVNDNNHVALKTKLWKHTVSCEIASTTYVFGFLSHNDTEVSGSNPIIKLAKAVAGIGWEVAEGVYEIPVVCGEVGDKHYFKLQQTVTVDDSNPIPIVSNLFKLIATDGTETSINGGTFTSEVVAYL